MQETILVEEVKVMLEERKFSKLKKYLEDLNSADIPCLFEELEDEQMVVVYRLLAKDVAAEDGVGRTRPVRQTQTCAY